MVVEELRDHYRNWTMWSSTMVPVTGPPRSAGKGIQFLDLPVNLGLAGCFQAGMKYAYYKGYPYAIQFDGDGQHRRNLSHPWQKKWKKAMTSSLEAVSWTVKDHSLRMIGSRLITAAIRLTHRCDGD